MTVIWAILFFAVGTWFGRETRNKAFSDLETENCELRDVNKDLRNDLANAKTVAEFNSAKWGEWRTKYEDLVEAVKKKAAEKPKKATSKK